MATAFALVTKPAGTSYYMYTVLRKYSSSSKFDQILTDLLIFRKILTPSKMPKSANIWLFNKKVECYFLKHGVVHNILCDCDVSVALCIEDCVLDWLTSIFLHLSYFHLRYISMSIIIVLSLVASLCAVFFMLYS